MQFLTLNKQKGATSNEITPFFNMQKLSLFDY